MAKKTLPLDLVSAFAGDRVMTEPERRRIEDLKSKRGKDI
jgi:hypothetical protein